LVVLELRVQKSLQKNKIMKWKDIKNIIKKELKEATEVSAGGSKFNLRMGVNKNKTKLGVKIQFEPMEGILVSTNPDDQAKKKELYNKLEVEIQQKLNDHLGQYKMQISKDVDAPPRTVKIGEEIIRVTPIAFFIPLLQIKALVTEGLGQGEAPVPDAPLAPEPTGGEEESPEEESPEDKDIEEMIQKEVLNEMRIRELNDISKVVRKEDFYDFINKGNNILRSLEDAGINNGKKYLAYLVKHNIM
jgi:hypothetical protein